MANPEQTQTQIPEINGRRSRLENRRARLERREETIQKQREARQRQKWLPWLIAAVVLVVLAAGAFFMFVLPASQPIPGVERFEPNTLSRDHVTGEVAYPQTPPVGGPHAAAWLNCGVYEEPQGSQFAVHSLEHGAVWITYRQDLPADQVQRIRDLARGNSYVLVTPWGGDPPLPSPIGASAWGLLLHVDSADDGRLREFVSRYANGPQTPERGALCSRGVGNPQPN